MTPSRYDQLDRNTSAASSEESTPAIATCRPAGIYESQTASGESVTSLVWPTPNEESPEDVHDATVWLQCDAIWRPFAESALILHSSVSSRSRQAIVGELNAGWWRFLIETERTEIILEQISNAVFGDFASWLQAEHGENATWSVGTCRKRYGRPLAIVRHLQTTKRIPQFYVASGQWRDTYKSFEPTKVISRPVFAKLLSAAAQALEETVRNRHRALDMIASKKETAIRIVERGQYKRGEYSNLATVLAVLDYRYDGAFPPILQIKRDDRTLWDAIATRHGGIRKIEAYFYPTTTSLIPFFIWLQATLAANIETLFKTKADDFQVEEILGTRRFVWRSRKNRAHRDVMRSLALSEDPLHPMNVLEFLNKWTARIRPISANSHRNMVFLTVGRVDPRKPGKAFVARAPRTGATRGTVTNALSQFLKTNGIEEKIQFKQIRTTVLDIADEISGGDIRAIAQLGDHASIDTTNRHYTSDGARSRDSQSLALVQNARERWLHSDGVIDIRGEPSNADRLSATPGWMCLDPFDSPVPSAKNGELCNAYGQCPICPHAAIDTMSPYALARLLQLRKIIHGAMSKISPERWLSVWKPCLESIETRWLTRFRDINTLDAADRLSLPNLPGVD